MLEKNLFLSIGKAGKTVVDKFIKPKVDEKVYEIFYEKYGDKKLHQKAEKWLEETYGNTVYYNDLDAYFKQNYTISRLIRVAHGEYDFEENNPASFTIKHYASFVKQYPQYTDVDLNQSIQKALSGLYEYIHHKINKISPYSESGKMQRDFKKIFNSHTDTILKSQEGMRQDLLCAIRELKENKEIGTTSFTADLVGKSEKVEQYLKDIQSIENNYQKNSLFEEAIQKYHEILAQIVCLPNISSEFQKLLGALYCNLSLCYSNMGNYESAQKYIKLIPPEISDNNPKYHFISAAIIVNAEDTAHYLDAVQHAECAVALDPKYHKAFNLAMYIRITLQPLLLSNIMNEYDDHFKEVISIDTTPEILFEYYSNRGLIQLIGNDSNNALIDLEKACEYGNDNTLQFNLASALYSVATKSMSQTTRLIFMELPQTPLLRAQSILIPLLDTDNSKKTLRKHVTTLYISICFLLGKPHGLLLENYISELEIMEPEIARIFLIECENITQEISEKYLSEDDRCYLIARKYFNSGALEECKAYIERRIAEGDAIAPPLYLTLIQACIAIPDIKSFWKYREHAHQYQLTGLYMTSLDARAHELEGDVDQAKKMIDELVLKTLDYSILMNAVRFYGRNGYSAEQRELYEVIYNKWSSLELCINDISDFLMSYITFLTENNDSAAVDILNSLPTDTLPTKIYNELYVNYYLRINSPHQMLPYAENLFNMDQDISSCKLYAQTLIRLFRYDDAISVCESLLDLNPPDTEKNEIFWMLSDIWFLNGNKDRSYGWAVRARDIVQHIPADRSHQLFMARALLCEHFEGLATTIDYKHKHPVVVDYIYEFHIDTESPTPGEDIMNILKSFGGDTDEQTIEESQIISYYKKKMLPTYAIFKYFSENWNAVHLFAQKHKLNVDLGDRELLHHDIEAIHGKIVVDAQTLIVMLLFDCINALDYIDSVLINAGSIDYLQQICFSSDNTYAVKALQYINNSNNISIVADGFPVESPSKDFFDNNFNICCILSQNLDIPFLYHDAFAKIIQSNTSIIHSDVRLVSIRAMCGYVQKQCEDIAEQWYYNLLKGCTFISCGANTIIYQIKSNNYEVTDELIQPFMFCKSNYDMESFASVYCTAIRELLPEHTESAEKLAEIVIQDTIRVWKRGQYYRMFSNEYPEHKEKAKRIMKYAMTIGICVSKLLPNPSLDGLREKISTLAAELADTNI